MEIQKTHGVLYTGDKTKEVLLKGTKKLYDAVSITLGAKGQNVIIKDGYNKPIITKDGVTVAKYVTDDDFATNGAIEVLRQAAEKTNEAAGDGTTTSIVLGYGIFSKGLEAIKSTKINSLNFKKGIDKAAKTVIEELSQMSKHDFNPYDVAYISANGDKEIATLIADAFKMVGKKGIIGIEQSDKIESYIVKDEGLKLDSGYASEYFAMNTTRGVINFKESYVLLVDGDIEKMDKLVYYLEAAHKQGKPIVVIAHNFGMEALNMFIKARVEQNVNCVMVKAPMYGEKRSAIINDISEMTGADIISEKKGNFMTFGLKGSNQDEMIQSCYEHFGNVKKARITKDNISLYYDVNEEYIKKLEYFYETTQNDFIKERIAMLTGDVATIFVGGNSLVEVKERVDRVEDAVNATREALKGGIVAGGGTALLLAREVISDMTFDSEDEKVGGAVLYEVLADPARKLLSNAEYDFNLEGFYYPNWINVNTGEKVNFFKEGIIDPLNVVTTALTNAVSVASTLLTSGGYVVFNV